MISAEFGTLPALRVVNGKSAFILAIPEPPQVCNIMAFYGYYYGVRAIILYTFGV